MSFSFFTPTGGCPTFIKLQSGPKNLTLSSFGVCDWTRIHSSGRVSQPDSLPAPMTSYDHRSLHTSGVSKLCTQWTGLKPAKRIGYAWLCCMLTKPGQKFHEISGFLDTPIGNNCPRSITGHRPSRAQFSRTRSLGHSLTSQVKGCGYLQDP